MSTYYVKHTTPTQWTVGTDTSQGRWSPLSDHTSAEDAEAQAAYLNNGACLRPQPEESENDRLLRLIAHLQYILAKERYAAQVPAEAVTA